MVKRASYTQAQRDEALQIYQAEGPTAAAKQTGIPKATVASWARRAGVHTVRNENVRARVEAAQLDNAERRARLIKRLYGIAESTVDLLERPADYKTIMRGDMGVERAGLPGFIPAKDKQHELTSIGIAIDKAERLEKFDSDNGAAVAKSMLMKLAEQIGVADD